MSNRPSSSGANLPLRDAMMPEMDGHVVCRRLMANIATRDIPVIFVTALGDPADEARGLEAGGQRLPAQALPRRDRPPASR